VYLIDEKYVLRVEVRQYGGQVAAAFDGRSRGDAYAHPHFDGDDICQRGLSEARGAVQQDVVEGFPARPRGRNSYAQVFFYLGLPDKFS
jgi:hypothetical protein